MIIASIKEGFVLAGRNLYLTGVRVVISIINLTGLIFFMAIPLLIGVLYLGIDISRLPELFPSITLDPSAFFSGYAGIIALFAVSLLIYLTLSSMLWLYTVSGVIGVLSEASGRPGRVTGLSDFFGQASQHFGRIFRLVSLVLLIVIVALIIAASFSLFAVYLFRTPGSGDSVPFIFIRSFAAVSLWMIALLISAGSMLLTVYSMIISAVERRGAVDAIKSAYEFMKRRPSALYFPLILVVLIVAVSVIFYMIQTILHLIPLVGLFLNIVLYLVNLAFQSYLSVALWAMLISFYRGCSVPGMTTD